MFLLATLVLVLVKSATSLVSIRESAMFMKVFSQVRDLTMVVLLQEQRQQATVFSISQKKCSSKTAWILLVRQFVSLVLVMLLSMLHRRHSRWVLMLLLLLIQQAGYTTRKALMLLLLRKSRKLSVQDFLSIQSIVQMQNITRANSFGQFLAMLLFHVQHRTSLMLRVHRTLSKTA